MLMGISDDKNLNANVKFIILLILTYLVLELNNDLIIQSIFLIL